MIKAVPETFNFSLHSFQISFQFNHTRLFLELLKTPTIFRIFAETSNKTLL